MTTDSKQKWTKGPWRIVDLRHQQGGKLKLCTDTEGLRHLHLANIMVGNQWEPTTAEECEANARLIAAAPEMYGQIQRTQEFFRYLKHINYDLWQKVMDAAHGKDSPSEAVDLWDGAERILAAIEGKE